MNGNDCTENSKLVGAKSRPQTTMEGKHAALEAAVKSLDKFEKDLYGINDSLGALANRINPEDYFGNSKNLETTAIPDSLQNTDGKPKRRIHGDGLVGSMDTHISELTHRIQVIQAGISLASRNISFLQEQI